MLEDAREGQSKRKSLKRLIAATLLGNGIKANHPRELRTAERLRDIQLVEVIVALLDVR